MSLVPFLVWLCLPLLISRGLTAVFRRAEAAVKRYNDRESPKSPYFGKSQIRHSELTHRYTRPRGKQPDYTAPVVLRNGKNTVRHFCDAIHKNIVPNFKNGESGFRLQTTTLLVLPLYNYPPPLSSLFILYCSTVLLLCLQ